MADETELDESGNPIVFFDISLGGEFPYLPFPSSVHPVLFALSRLRPAETVPPLLTHHYLSQNCLCMIDLDVAMSNQG